MQKANGELENGQEINWSEGCSDALETIYTVADAIKEGPKGELTELPDPMYIAEAKIQRAKRLFEKGYGINEVKKAIPDFVAVLSSIDRWAKEIEDDE